MGWGCKVANTHNQPTLSLSHTDRRTEINFAKIIIPHSREKSAKNERGNRQIPIIEQLQLELKINENQILS